MPAASSRRACISAPWLGGAVGLLVNRFAPFPTADAGAYALVGMGTLFAGIIRAPMTSVFMIFEITQDYQILVPLMVANLLSFVISRALPANAACITRCCSRTACICQRYESRGRLDSCGCDDDRLQGCAPRCLDR